VEQGLNARMGPDCHLISFAVVLGGWAIFFALPCGLAALFVWLGKSGVSLAIAAVSLPPSFAANVGILVCFDAGRKVALRRALAKLERRLEERAKLRFAAVGERPSRRSGISNDATSGGRLCASPSRAPGTLASRSWRALLFQVQYR
jgi:hypothetical protein